MTKTQTEIYEIIASSCRETGYSIPATHIARQLGKSRQYIDQTIDILVALGKLKKLRKGLVVLVD